MLHHVTSSFNDTAQPIPQSGVRGQVTQIPSVIITLHRAGSYDEAVVLGASLVKNRGGRSDASGQTVTRLTFDMRNLRITEEPAWETLRQLMGGTTPLLIESLASTARLRGA